jgi:tetratricopeptide (TPR) repeat protein
MRQISNWVSKRPGNTEIETLLDQHAERLSESAVEQLSLALRLFDWTVRGIQLDPLLPFPIAAVSLKPGEERVVERPPPMRGIPGPGYQYPPWQTLLFGHGDAWQRARVFILLCRQQGVQAVVLAFPGKTTPPRPRAWLPAVLIEDQLYLFDIRLGLPIPGPSGRGIATLEQVLENPAVLEQLTIDESFQYEIDRKDLQSVLALLDTSLASLSLRMQLVEQQLTGEHRTVLTFAPTPLAEQLAKCRGVTDVALWRIPYETDWFQAAKLRRLAEDPQAAAIEFTKTGVFFKKTGVFTLRNALVKGRYLHFRGRWDKLGETPGAKTLYMQARVPQSQIDKIESSEAVQQQFGLTRAPNEHEIVWRNRLASTKIAVSQAKQHATYWLGLAQYETGTYDAAVEWLQRRTIKETPDSPWLDGARYNLARAYEALGDAEQARRWYIADDDSPQRHGHLLRARRLRKQTEKQPTEDSAS